MSQFRYRADAFRLSQLHAEHMRQAHSCEKSNLFMGYLDIPLRDTLRSLTDKVEKHGAREVPYGRTVLQAHEALRENDLMAEMTSWQQSEPQ